MLIFKEIFANESSSLLWFFFVFFSVPIFRCTVRFLLRVQSSFSYLFFPLIHCSLFMSMLVLWSSVSLHSHSTWSTDRSVLQKGHSGLPTPSILGPWVAFVYPVLSLLLLYCYLLFPWTSFCILLSVDVRLPLFHLVVSVFPSLVSFFEVLFGQPFLQVVWQVSFSGWDVLVQRFFRCLVGFSLPGIPL
jgi:hypothetical protein